MSTRRHLLAASAGGVALAGLSSALPLAAAILVPTPAQSRGPFYPAEIPLDNDNDLVRVAGYDGRAQGQVTDLLGRVLDERARPVPAARIEIWQCNAYGRYHHPWDRRNVPLDPGFQGYGRFTTGAEGRYRFRTIKPVPYPGRAPHIHFAVSGPAIPTLVTQMYVKGEPANDRDALLNRIRDAKARERLIVPLLPQTGGDLLGHFDIVLIADGSFGT